MIGRLRQLLEPRLRQQAGIEKSQTPVERDILVQWVRKTCHQHSATFQSNDTDVVRMKAPLSLAKVRELYCEISPPAVVRFPL